jgi:hypothetical protein
MAQQDKQSRATLQELLLSSLAQIDALAKLPIEKDIISKTEFLQQISQERTAYQSTVAQRFNISPGQDAPVRALAREPIEEVEQQKCGPDERT